MFVYRFSKFCFYKISFTRKPLVVGSSMMSLTCGRRLARTASDSGVSLRFSTMKSRAVTPESSVWVRRTVMGRTAGKCWKSTSWISFEASPAFSAILYLMQN